MSKEKEISDDELRLVMKNYSLEMENLYNMMPILTWNEYRGQFSEIFKKLHENSGQHLILPNTGWIEKRALEVFSKSYWSNLNL